MIKEAIKIGRARYEQKHTIPTVRLMLEFGFTQNDIMFSMGNLNIQLIEGYFYYITPKNKLKRLENIYQVSNLVYGKTQYG